MFSTCKTPHEALAALLLLALPEGMQLELPETLRKKKVTMEMGISAPEKSCLSPRIILPMGKMHMFIKPHSSATGEMDNRTPCATINTLIFWDTNTTHRSCRAGRWVREKVYPLKGEAKCGWGKFIRQKKTAVKMPHKHQSQWDIPSTCAGNKTAHPPVLVPRHLALFQRPARDFHWWLTRAKTPPQ